MMILVGVILGVRSIVAPEPWRTEDQNPMTTRPREAPEVREFGVDTEPRRGVGDEKRPPEPVGEPPDEAWKEKGKDDRSDVLRANGQRQ